MYTSKDLGQGVVGAGKDTTPIYTALCREVKKKNTTKLIVTPSHRVTLCIHTVLCTFLTHTIDRLPQTNL